MFVCYSEGMFSAFLRNFENLQLGSILFRLDKVRLVHIERGANHMKGESSVMKLLKNVLLVLLGCALCYLLVGVQFVDLIRSLVA